MYEAPINIILNPFCVVLKNGIMEVAKRWEVSINEEELVKALQYDREQYLKGYEDGKGDSVVLHGQWIDREEDMGTYVCSECRGYLGAWYEGVDSREEERYLDLPRFCPFCGAKMDREDALGNTHCGATKLTSSSATCGATGLTCIWCKPGPCNRREERQ